MSTWSNEKRSASILELELVSILEIVVNRSLEEARVLGIWHAERHGQRRRISLWICEYSVSIIARLRPVREADSQSPAGENLRCCSICKIFAMDGSLSFDSDR